MVARTAGFVLQTVRGFAQTNTLDKSDKLTAEILALINNPSTEA